MQNITLSVQGSVVSGFTPSFMLLGCVLIDEQCSSRCVKMCIMGTVGHENFASKAVFVMIVSSLIVDLWQGQGRILSVP
jgi:hypothetical protein